VGDECGKASDAKSSMLQYEAPVLSEEDFVAVSTRVLDAIGAALDAAIDDADADLDWSLNDGVLNIDCGARCKLVVNRHVPNREMWIAAKSGGFHFRAEDGAWRDTRSGEELAAALARLMREQAAIDVTLPALTSVAAIR